MECKDRSSFTVVASSIGINRNIVECKESTNRSIFGKRCGVLIETLWNVKTGTVTEQRCSVNVLIETLWNVKTKAEQKLIEESGINDKIKAELSEAKIKGVDKIKPDKMTLRNSLSIMDI